jgi:parallel beta-helix repeat protein
MANVSADHEGKSGARQWVQLSFAVVTTLAAILAAICPAKAATPITSCPTVITVGGTAGSPALYTLTQDLLCSGTDGIDIEASYVKLNLNGHRITGGGSVPPGYGNGYGIFVYSNTSSPVLRLTGIVITGPSPGLSSIQGFTNGIELDDVDSSTVQNVVLSNNMYGLSTDLRDTVNNTVTGLKVLTDTATLNNQNGIALFNSSWSTVSGNITTGNGSGSANGGILIWGGSNNLVTLNNADGNTADGIDIYNSSKNSVNWNWASGNIGAGIQIFVTSNSNLVFFNSAEGNRNPDLEDNDTSCGSNNWFSNWFDIGNQTCIH